VEVDTPSRSSSPVPDSTLTEHEKDLLAADGLRHLPWFSLRRKILARFPHPDIKERNSLAGINGVSLSHQYQRMSTVSQFAAE
jgi:hypothetical protein